jgi:antitoxin component YwqK of YwqJK toxin-antitoxin module
MKHKKIISIILLALFFTVAAFIYSYIAGKSAARLIAQHGNMVVMKMQIYAYEEKYDIMPKNLKVMELPSHFTKNLNIEYPDEKYMFFEKEPKKYGSKEGRFFVYKDGFIEFVPTGKVPPERRSYDKKSSPISGEETGCYASHGKGKAKIKFIKYYEKSIRPVKIIYYYRNGLKKSQELYKDGMKHGEFIKWNEEEKVLKKEYYENGVLQDNLNTEKEKTKDNKTNSLDVVPPPEI